MNDIIEDEFVEMNSNIAYVADLEKQVETLTTENTKLKSDYLYLRADFDNVKKRYNKQIEDLKTNAAADTVKKLFDCINEVRNAAKYAEGADLIYKKFEDTLSKMGVIIISPEEYNEFDVNTMNAITVVPTEDKDIDNTIFKCTTPGFKMGNNVIKYADVVVYQYQGN